MAPTKDSYVLIEAGKTITSPVLDLTSSYKFDSDGIYTIEYTKPFVYISDAEMSMIDDDKNLPQATGYDDLVASTEIELRDTYYLKPTNYEVEMANKKFKEKTSLDDQIVYVSDGCCGFGYENMDGPPEVVTKQLIADIPEINTKLCDIGLPNAINDATTNSDQAPYKTYFGSQSNSDPLRVLNDVATAIHTETKVIDYSFRGPDCKKKDYAYVTSDTDKVYLCEKFETSPKYIEKKKFKLTNYDTKFQTLAYEYTHLFANTADNGYGHLLCTTVLSKSKAVNNADSFGYYIQDLSDEATKN